MSSGYELIMGERRWRAARLVGIKQQVELDEIVEKTSLKNNPIHLKRKDLHEILISRI